MLSSIVKRVKSRPICFVYTIAAQRDNLGDIAIRLRVLSWLRETDGKIFVYVGSMPESYLEPFDLDEDITTMNTKFEVLRTIPSLLFKYRVFMIFPPGPVKFGGFKNTLRTLINFAILFIVSLGGGGAVHAGASFRQEGRVGTTLHKAFLSSLKLCVVRDSKSLLTNKVHLSPDLAFNGSSLPKETERFRLTISLRNDYEVSDDFLKDCKRVAEENGWQLTFVAQVERDDTNHRLKAKMLGADCFEWQGSHTDQLSRVQDVYGESVAVVTDRLHALIFSMNAGALPVALVHRGNDKLTSSFKHVWEIPQVKTEGDRLGDEVVSAIINHSSNPSEHTDALNKADKRVSYIKTKIFEVLA